MIGLKERRQNFIPMEWQASVPDGSSIRYVLKSSYTPISRGMSLFEEERVISMSMESDPEFPHFKVCSIKTLSHLVKINNRSSSTTAVLQRVATIYDQLELQRTLNGSVVLVKNFPEIKRKWEAIKTELSVVNSGTNFEQFIVGMDRNLNSEESLRTYLNSYKNFGLLLQGIYGRHDNFQGTTKTNLFVGTRRTVAVDETISLHGDHSEENIILKLTGVSKNERKFPKYAGNFRINKTNAHIEKAELNVEEQINEKRYVNKYMLTKKDS